MKNKIHLTPEVNTQMAALMLRIGLGLVFVIGGTSKLSLLLSEINHDAMVANYMSTSGYINSLFQDFLFTGALGTFMTPSGFLTTLSTFELISGIALITGLLIRPLSLFYAFLLWTFVIALPTMTVPGIGIDAKTYTSPAIFAQIRDIALSGFMFVLYNLGSGTKSIDQHFAQPKQSMSWDTLGLLLRMSLASVMVVAGFFGNFSSVPSFSSNQLLMALTGLVLVFGNKRSVQLAGLVTMGVMLWYMFNKIGIDKSLIKNLNGFKREFALFSGGLILGLYGGGERFTAKDLIERSKSYLLHYFKRVNA